MFADYEMIGDDPQLVNENDRNSQKRRDQEQLYCGAIDLQSIVLVAGSKYGDNVSVKS